MLFMQDSDEMVLCAGNRLLLRSAPMGASLCNAASNKSLLYRSLNFPSFLWGRELRYCFQPDITAIHRTPATVPAVKSDTSKSR